MSIEVQISKLIEALDNNTTAANQLAGVLTNAKPTAEPEKPKTYVQERKAEIKAEAKKPIKVTPVKEPDPVPEEPDDFLGDEPEPEAEPVVTIEQVRKALIAYRTEKGKDPAMALLAKHGNGALKLPGPNAAPGVVGPGELAPEFYAAVLKAVSA